MAPRVAESHPGRLPASRLSGPLGMGGRGPIPRRSSRGSSARSRHSRAARATQSAGAARRGARAGSAECGEAHLEPGSRGYGAGGDGGSSGAGSRHNRPLPLTGNLGRQSRARGRQGAGGTPWPAAPGAGPRPAESPEPGVTRGRAGTLRRGPDGEATTICFPFHPFTAKISVLLVA